MSIVDVSLTLKLLAMPVQAVAMDVPSPDNLADLVGSV
jgi:hypothetical protein